MNTLMQLRKATSLTALAPVTFAGGGFAALTMIPQIEAKLFTGAALFAIVAGAAGAAIRQALFAPRAEAQTLGDYPAASANPWERCGAPHGF